MRKLVTKLKYILQLGSPLAVRLVAATGKHSYPMHPKHLIGQSPWFLSFIKPSDTVLDLGCGNGQLTLKTAKICRKIIGLDRNYAHLESARIEAEKEGITNTAFTEFDIEQELPFKQGSFTVVIMQDVLEHVWRDKRLLVQAHRVLGQNGRLILAVPNSETSWKRQQKAAGYSGFSDSDHKREYTQQQIRQLLVESKFTIVSCAPVSYSTWLAGLIDLSGGLSISLYEWLSHWKRQQGERFPKEAEGWHIVATKL